MVSSYPQFGQYPQYPAVYPQQPQQPVAQSFGQPTKSAAFVINFNAPISGGDAAPSMGGGFGQPAQQGFGPAGYPANYNNPSINPFANPQQALQEAYNNAVNARNAAEQARVSYLNTANQLNQMAQQQPQFQQNPFGQPANFPGYPPQPFGPQAGFPGQQPFAYPPQPFGPQVQPQQLPPAGQFPPPPEPQLPPPPEQTPEQQPTATEPTEAEKPVEAKPLEQQQPKPEAPSSLKKASMEELYSMISQPTSSQDKLQAKLNAMEEVAVRGSAPLAVYELLKKEALADTSELSGQQLDDANFVRQAALWALGMLNKSQNGTINTNELPGLKVIETILSNPKENPDVQTAAIQALQVIDRPTDKRIKKSLKAAMKSKDEQVRKFAKDAMDGVSIPLPTQGGEAGMPPGPGVQHG